ncbi:MAG: TonB-dependent receptor [Bacteroidota bacterium]
MKIKIYCFWILIMASVSGYAQTVISGTVRDNNNEALIGSNVVLKETSNGTVTDVNGEFRLEIPAGTPSPVIIISMIGYITQEIPVGSQSTFDIKLVEDSQMLNEVVVTGYTSQRKDKITGAVAIVSKEDLNKINVPTFDQALQGRAAGVVVSQNTGAPGEGVSIRIRGVGSINSGNNPLYIVDGLPTLDISNISTRDIESLTVLKDAAAAAVYGARAANGVVIVTTRKGSSNGPQVQINSQVGFQEPSRKIKMANTAEYAQIYNEAANNDNANKTNPIFFRKLITDDIAANLPNTDWVDAIMQKGLVQTHTVSVSGGNDKTTYYIAGNYFGQQGIVRSSDYERKSGRVNVDTEVKSWLHAGVNLNVSSALTDLIGSSGDGAGGNGGSVLRYAYFRTPALAVYDDNGNFTDKPTRYDLFGDGYNPVGMLAYNQNKKSEDRVFGKIYVNIEPLKGLKFISNLGVDLDNIGTRRFDRTWGTDNRINGINRLAVTSTKIQTITWSNFATYTKTINDQHTFTVLLGTETIKSSTYAINDNQSNFPDQDPSLVYIGNGIGTIVSNESQYGNALASFFGKVDYDFSNKYLVSATVRRDGSSRFGPDNRWGTYYAGSLGWRLDQEFFKENDNIDKWLLRAGYGSIGNQEIGNYAYTSLIGLSSYYPYGSTRTLGSSLQSYGNSKIKWETSRQFNVGTDIELWSGKLIASVDYYRKETVGLLIGQPLAASVGSVNNAVAVSNNGNVVNSGIEIALGHSNNIGDFHYTINANAATVHNELTKLPGTPIAKGAVGSTFLTQTEKGYPVGSFYLYEAEGIFQNDAQIFTHANQGSGIKPGDVMYKDQDGNGIIDGNDRVHVGSAIPKITGGLNLSMSYKNWDMSVFFQGAYGQKIFSVLNRDIEGFYRPFNVTQRYFDQHWTGEGTSNTMPRASWDASGNNNLFSTRFLEDGSYTRLKNLQLGYNIPKAFLERYGFAAIRIYVSGTNLLTFTKYSGADPEMTVSDNARGSGDLANGIDWGTYPAARSYNVGVNLTF